MSDNSEPTVILTKQQTNILEFDVIIDGLDEGTVTTRFVITLPDKANLWYVCDRREGDNWQVSIPDNALLEVDSLYPFYVEVLVDGYYFKSLVGNVKVKERASVSTTDIDNVTIPQQVEPPVEEEEIEVVDDDVTVEETVAEEVEEVKPYEPSVDASSFEELVAKVAEKTGVTAELREQQIEQHVSEDELEAKRAKLNSIIEESKTPSQKVTAILKELKVKD
jgi:hypothetical protein